MKARITRKSTGKDVKSIREFPRNPRLHATICQSLFTTFSCSSPKKFYFCVVFPTAPASNGQKQLLNSIWKHWTLHLRK